MVGSLGPSRFLLNYARTRHSKGQNERDPSLAQDDVNELLRPSILVHDVNGEQKTTSKIIRLELAATNSKAWLTA